MRRLKRPVLDQAEIDYLLIMTARVMEADDPASAAKTLWANKNRDRFAAIRQKLLEFAPGARRCMYCEDSAGTDIDHFEPKVKYPSRAFDWSNYFLACGHCNSNAKRDAFPVAGDGARLLLNPCEDRPVDHLTLSPVTGEFAGRTEMGFRSMEVFELNREALSRGRYDAWIACDTMLRALYGHRKRGDHAAAHQVEATLLSRPFGEVLETMYSYAANGYELLHRKVRSALLESHAIGSRFN